MSPRTWLVTARSADGKFIDQRRIEAVNQSTAESDAIDWIHSRGGDIFKSTWVEVQP